MESISINELNQKAWNKILTKQIGQLKKSLEIEIEYCDYILYDLPTVDKNTGKPIVFKTDMFRNKIDYADIIENLEYILNDFYKSSFTHANYPETLNCNFQTLETILKEIKGHE